MPRGFKSHPLRLGEMAGTCEAPAILLFPQSLDHTGQHGKQVARHHARIA